MSKPEMTNRALMIVEHWEEHFPEIAEELKDKGLLEKTAAAAADRAAIVLEQAAQKGISIPGAMELASQEWSAPPTLSSPEIQTELD